MIPPTPSQRIYTHQPLSNAPLHSPITTRAPIFHPLPYDLPPENHAAHHAPTRPSHSPNTTRPHIHLPQNAPSAPFACAHHAALQLCSSASHRDLPVRCGCGPVRWLSPTRASGNPVGKGMYVVWLVTSMCASGKRGIGAWQSRCPIGDLFLLHVVKWWTWDWRVWQRRARGDWRGAEILVAGMRRGGINV